MLLRGLLAVLVATVFAGCSSGSDDGEPISDPDGLVDRSLANMQALESYRMEMAFSPEGVDIPILVDYDRDRYYELITDPSDDGGKTELIAADGYVYVRFCEEDPERCEVWERSESTLPIPSLGGLTTTVPEILALVAVDLASNWHQASTGGSGTTLSGEVNFLLAVEESRRRALLAGGLSEEEVDSSIQDQRDGRDPTEYPLLRVDVTIDRQEQFLSLVTLTVPADEEAGTDDDVYFYAKYSRLNDVTVEPPTEFETVPF